ncbi:hypothetical protein A2U01_0054011, partial [Trifolium medium]|nr:hypothetical protein [Trifolium medium]
IVMDDSNASKDDRHKVDINVDAKPADEPPKVVVVAPEIDVVAPKVDVVARKVDFCIEFTTERKANQLV